MNFGTVSGPNMFWSISDQSDQILYDQKDMTKNKNLPNTLAPSCDRNSEVIEQFRKLEFFRVPEPRYRDI